MIEFLKFITPVIGGSIISSLLIAAVARPLSSAVRNFLDRRFASANSRPLPTWIAK